MNSEPPTAEHAAPLPAQDGKEGLLSVSFLGLLLTQFLGA